jgi:hypothetical protein
MDINYTKSSGPWDHFLRAAQFVQRQWFNAILLYLALHIVLNKNISIKFGFDEGPAQVKGMQVLPTANTVSYAPKSPRGGGEGFSISNLTPVLSPDYGERKGIPKSVIRAKLKVCKDYVRDYAPIAIQEMEKYGIPASITLAQGLLESNAGDSKLARESLNHFGIKCRSKCRGCTCRNYTDDDVYDMFRVFESVYDSYREHSLLLTSAGRYRGLFELDPKDYEAWAYGLKAAGYATDSRYPQKLIQIIKTLDLDKYDR